MSQQLTRDELEERVGELEERQEMLVETIFELEDALTGERGSWVATQIAEEDGSVLDRLDDLEAEAPQGPNPEVRKRVLPLHRKLMDVRTEAADAPEGNKRRAVELFRMMMRVAANDNDAFGVTQSSGKWEISRERAEDIISFGYTLPQSGVSKTIRRTMVQAQKLSQREPCDCDDPEKCSHGLLQFRKTDSYQLTADVDAFHRYFESVEQLVEEVDADEIEAADDGEEHSSEALSTQTDEHMDSPEETFQMLEEATTERNATSGETTPADTVVRQTEQSVSDGGDSNC